MASVPPDELSVILPELLALKLPLTVVVPVFVTLNVLPLLNVPALLSVKLLVPLIAMLPPITYGLLIAAVKLDCKFPPFKFSVPAVAVVPKALLVAPICRVPFVTVTIPV